MSDSSREARPSAAKRESAANPERGASSPREAGGLSREVHTLTTVIKQLEEQLDQMMAANDALRKDQEDERSKNLTLQNKLEELHDRLRRSEKQIGDKEDLAAEAKHLTLERARLFASERELRAKLADMEQQRDREQRLVERLRTAHTDAVDDVANVEAQFERAMQLVAQTRAQLTIACEERDQLASRRKTLEGQLAQLRQERDALLAEVEQSRAALDEIRRSLVDACQVSTGASGEEPARKRAAVARAAEAAGAPR